MRRAAGAVVGTSAMTLGGMKKHLALVEDWWFTQVLHGQPLSAPWEAGGLDADPDWDWHSAADDSPAEIDGLWQDAVTRSKTRLAQALADEGLDSLARQPMSDGQLPSLRWIICHMIEEYARHNGHADLIRESVDGRTGEWPRPAARHRPAGRRRPHRPAAVGRIAPRPSARSPALSASQPACGVRRPGRLRCQPPSGSAAGWITAFLSRSSSACNWRVSS